MGRNSRDVLNDSAERLVAELTVTAHGVALRHGRGESFVDLQLALWEALRRVVKQEVQAFAQHDRLGSLGREDRLEGHLARPGSRPGDRQGLSGREDRLCCCT